MTGRLNPAPVIIAIGALLFLVGCHNSWRPSVETLRPADGMRIDLWSRSAPPGAKLTFRESNLLDESQPARTYQVQLAEGGLVAGELKPAEQFDLSPFVRADRGDDRPRFGWPNMKDRSAKGFLLEFDPPLLNLPPVVSGDTTQRSKCAFVYHDWRGKQVAKGTATRTFSIEGYENTQVGDRTYPDTVLLRVDTLLIVPLIARVEVVEYRWLAPEVGEVKRIQQVDGIVLLRGLKSATRYELARAVLPRTNPARQATQPSETGARWQRCAVYLEPSVPRPQVRGLVVEFAPYQTPEGQ